MTHAVLHAVFIALHVMQVERATVCFADHYTTAPITGTLLVRVEDGQQQPRSLRAAGDCVNVPVGAWRVRRVGYRSTSITLRGGATDTVWFQPTTSAGVMPLTVLDTIQARAGRVPAAVARTVVTVSTSTARRAGAGTVSQLLEQLPYVSMRASRGETGLSLRGSRREQVVVTLDGLALNDPASGIADVADIPLATLSSATVALGADPVNGGSGAAGGVIALTRAAQRVMSAHLGAFGSRGGEAGWSVAGGPVVAHATVMYRTAINDYAFVNDAGASGRREREERVNNDETRAALSVGLTADRWQLFALASRADRGMVGPINVRAYDRDRARTHRVLVRGQAMLPRAQVTTGVRYFSLDYRDPARPASDARAESIASDLAVQGSAALSTRLPVTASWRAGAGADALRATGGISQSRTRAFVASQAILQRSSWRVEAGARADVIEGTAAVPSFTVAAERPVGAGFSLGARVAQAMRVPTLYDLYFSSPQRVTVRTLRPERVLADVDVSAHWKRATILGRAAIDASLVSRTTRDAIIWFPGNFGWSPANVGQEQLQGGELRAHLAAGWGELSAWSTVYDSQLITDALRIPTPYVARVAFGGSAFLRAGSLTGAVMSRVSGRRPFSAGPRNAAFELPAVALMDVSVSHPLPRSLQPKAVTTSVVWSISNVMNVEWQSVRGFPAARRSWMLSFLFQPTR